VVLTLYLHQSLAYEAAVHLLTDKRGAVIHPTDTRKSYIAFKFIKAHPTIGHMDEWFHVWGASLHCCQAYSENVEAGQAARII